MNKFITSCFVKTVGILFSLLGLFIAAVGSFFKIEVKEYLIAAKNIIVEIAALSEKFSATYSFTSSSLISPGFFLIKSKKLEFNFV